MKKNPSWGGGCSVPWLKKEDGVSHPPIKTASVLNEIFKLKPFSLMI
ncbi:hypothetical protein [Mucilaginibacter metallidurans]|nr:hypothetical protein [Mucilaginibacter gossypii]